MRAAPSSRLRRRVVVGGAGLLAGMLGGWLAGLLRGPSGASRHLSERP